MEASHKFKTVDEYHAQFPEHIQTLLNLMRKTIREAAPEAEETISYNMPGFRWNGMLVWYAGYKGHIGFYPSSTPMQVFKKELEGYKTSKGAIQFPLDAGIPVALVKAIVKYRMEENAQKAHAKTTKKK